MSVNADGDPIFVQFRQSDLDARNAFYGDLDDDIKKQKTRWYLYRTANPLNYL